MITTLDNLAPSGRAAATAFLEGAGRAVPRRLRDELRDDLTALLCEQLQPGGSAVDVERLVAELGDMEGVHGESELPGVLRRLAAGVDPRGLGARLAASLWNPADERLLLPRAFGWGWDLNFGAVAVRLGLIEPDAEAVPFEATPPAAFRAAAAIPVGLAVGVGLRYLAGFGRLPDQVPSHWDVSGRPDRWVSRRRAAVTDLAVAGASAAWAVATAASSRPGPSKAGLLAAATTGAGIATATSRQRGLDAGGGSLTTPAMLAATLGGVGVLLTGLARAGRRAEIERDLKEQK